MTSVDGGRRRTGSGGGNVRRRAVPGREAPMRSRVGRDRVERELPRRATEGGAIRAIPNLGTDVSRDRQFPARQRVGKLVMFGALGIAACQLLWVQSVSAGRLSAEAASQRTTTMIEPALRGSISDRNGKLLAFTVDAKALTFQPVGVRAQLEKAFKADPKHKPDPQKYLDKIATTINQLLGAAVPKDEVLDKLRSNDKFAYLARSVDPAVASKINKQFPEVGLERQDIREYPGGALAANVIGSTGWDGHGLIGLESSLDATLAGSDGSQTYDRGSDGAVIPGSWRDQQPAVDGRKVELTLDTDLQYYVQQQVQQAKEMSGSKNASAVVLDSRTGEVLAMANDNTFNPALGLGKAGKAELGNLAVSSPFEPGSVNKIVTAAAAVEYGLTTPEEVHDVPGSIDMGGVTVNDAWEHGVAHYTTAGIFGKSSNVGTLQLAQRVGPERYFDMLKRFGIGKRTEVGLPGESGGDVPEIEQWSGSTFSNLPIGQGVSMTLLQMTSMYQAVANDGLRVPPRIVKATIDSDGGRVTPPPRNPTYVMSPKTSQTLRDMFRAVTQKDPMGHQQGTGPSAGIDGFQIAGKTGTAQQVDPNCGCYSTDKYWITFAGIAPAVDPRYVIGIMLDAPQRAIDGRPGQSAAPLFHNIASWLLQRDNAPLSRDPGRPLVLDADAPTL